MPSSVTKDLDVLDIRDFGAVADGSYAGGSWTGTDNKQAYDDAISAARDGQIVYTPPGNWLSSPIDRYEKTISLVGANPFLSRLIAHPASPAGSFMVTLAREAGGTAAQTPGALGNHQHGVGMRNLCLDGNGRTVDVGGIDYQLTQHSYMENVEVRHFARQGIWGRVSVRESAWVNVQVRYCGDSDRDMAGWDMRHDSTTEGHNNLWFFGCESNKNFGYQFSIGSITDKVVRNIFWFGGLLHGSSDGVEGETVSWYGYNDARMVGPLALVQHARSVNFIGTRFQGVTGGDPMISMQASPGPANTRNTVSFTDVEFGSAGTGPIVDAQVAEYIQASNVKVASATPSAFVNNPTDADLRFSGSNDFGSVPSHISPAGQMSVAYWDDRIEAVNGLVVQSPNGTRWLVTVDDAGLMSVSLA